jgi:ABC-type transporter Mla subunit MlaD
MPEETRERHDVIVTERNGRNAAAIILAAIIIAAAVIFGIWYFGFQTEGGEGDSPEITIEVDVGDASEG